MKHIVALFLALTGLCAPAADKPNIVFVITDDQGYGDLGCTGNPIIQTPHMDALAAESSCLTDYHVAPTCSPTRAAVLTGHWSNRTGVWHTIKGRSMLRTDEITLAELLRRNGYATGMFGKWHLGDNYPYRPEDRGFTEVYRHGGGGVGQTPDYWDNAYFDGQYFHNGNVVPAKGFCTEVFFEAGANFIRQCAAEKKPFFAYISTNAPHGPFHCPEEYFQQYAGLPKYKAAFLGMITHIDHHLGKTRALLQELGIHENTIFIFTTDNGTALGASIFNAGMRGSKGSQYDGGHRVPFFLHWPAGGMHQKHVVEELTHAVDVVPTLLDLTGTTAPADLAFDGVSLRPLLDPRIDADWPDRLLITDSQRVVDPVKWRKSAVMSDRWRLIDGIELYDMEADPGQKIDVAALHPDEVARMRACYDTWWAELEPTFSRTTEIPIGHPDANPVTLTCHDWIGGAENPPWNQGQVRWAGRLSKLKSLADARHDSHWAVQVVEDGRYEIAVMRWPAEARHPIRAALPAGKNVPGASKAYRANPGRALPITEAHLIIDGQKIATQAVEATDHQVTFITELQAGSRQLAPVFTFDQGGEVGAYYTVIRRL